MDLLTMTPYIDIISKSDLRSENASDIDTVPVLNEKLTDCVSCSLFANTDLKTSMSISELVIPSLSKKGEIFYMYQSGTFFGLYIKNS